MLLEETHMKIIGMMLARNEAWCIGLAARVALQWCDELVVLDHASTDGTREVVEQIKCEHPGRVTLVCEDHAPFNEAQFRQRLLDAARERSVTHGAIIDADEFLTANLLKHARMLASQVHPGVTAYFPSVNPHDSMNRYRIDSAFATELKSVLFVDHPELSYCAAPDGYHYHERAPRATRPWAVKLENFQLEGGIWHLHSISRRRLEVKAACYKVLERVHFPARHSADKLEEIYGWTLRAAVKASATPKSWVEGYQGLIDAHLDLSVEPWQLQEMRRLMAAHPRVMFADLDLYGVA